MQICWRRNVAKPLRRNMSFKDDHAFDPSGSMAWGHESTPFERSRLHHRSWEDSSPSHRNWARSMRHFGHSSSPTGRCWVVSCKVRSRQMRWAARGLPGVSVVRATNAGEAGTGAAECTRGVAGGTWVVAYSTGLNVRLNQTAHSIVEFWFRTVRTGCKTHRAQCRFRANRDTCSPSCNGEGPPPDVTSETPAAKQLRPRSHAAPTMRGTPHKAAR
jgi:hypothetical protein